MRWTHVLAITMVTRVPSTFPTGDVSSPTSSSLLAALDPSSATPSLSFNLCTNEHARIEYLVLWQSARPALVLCCCARGVMLSTHTHS